MASNSIVAFDPALWESITKEATRRRTKPQNLITKIVREYLETEADLAWWRSVQPELPRIEMTDQEAVDFVHAIRRERKNRPAKTVPARRSKKGARTNGKLHKSGN